MQGGAGVCLCLVVGQCLLFHASAGPEAYLAQWFGALPGAPAGLLIV